MSTSPVVLDASAAINLLGCGFPETILDSFSGRCVIEEKTLAEVLYDPYLKTPAAPTIDRLTSRGSLRVERMSSGAYLDYLDLVSGDLQLALGHGESAALAYASATDGIVVLDDRKARRIGKSRFARCVQWTSVRLFRTAAEEHGISTQEISRLVQLARQNSRMHILELDQAWVDGLPVSQHGAHATAQDAVEGRS